LIDVVSFSLPSNDNLGTVNVFVDKLDQKAGLTEYVNNVNSSYHDDLNKFNVIESKIDNVCQ
jgi:hypothetical protein